MLGDIASWRETIELAYRVGRRAYILTFPLVLAELVRRRLSPAGGTARTDSPDKPLFVMIPAESDCRVWRRPDIQTLTTTTWLDARDEPIALQVPDAGDRFVMLQLTSMWGDVVASLGSRLRDDSRLLLLVDPRWDGAHPIGADVVYLAGRARLTMSVGIQPPCGTRELRAARDWYAACRLAPHSRLARALPPQFDSRAATDANMLTSPLDEIRELEPREYFTLACGLLRDVAPAPTDLPVLDDMKQIGLEPSERLTWQALSPLVRRGLVYASNTTLNEIELAPMPGRIENGWTVEPDHAGDDAFQRAVTAFNALTPSPAEDLASMCIGADDHDRPLRGAAQYRLHFERDNLPPAKRSWSLTMYDRSGFLVDAPLRRHALRGDAGLVPNDDGSLDLSIQREVPHRQRLSNWLPAPPGHFTLQLRLYWPSADVATGQWRPPPLERVG